MDKKKFVKDLMAVVEDFTNRAKEEEIGKVEFEDDQAYSRRSFGADIPSVGWVNVSYTERLRK